MSLVNMKVGAKLFLGFGSVIVFLVMSGLGTWIYSSSVTANYEIQNSNLRGTVELANIERGMWSLRFGIANYPGADENGRAKIMSDEAVFYREIQHALDAFGALGNLTAEEARAISTLKETIARYMASRP
ncbi:MAG: MCP four helix bundle domain-containing protein, partial [Gallionella sp.]|nr:MCP four helix bundle domain-containing protein [Gallionella sp.]